MSDYTPRTEEVRADYIALYNSGACCDEHAAEVYDAAHDFDRWLGKILISEREDERSIIISRLQEEATRLYRTNEKDSAIMADGIRAAARLLGGG